MNSLRDAIAFNSGVKRKQEILNENCDPAKKEMIVMRRVLDIVTSFITQVEDLKFDLSAPVANRFYGGPATPSQEPTITPEEMVAIKKKAYDLFMAKMKIADDVIHATFGTKHEDKEEEKAEEKEEDKGEEW